VVAQSGKISAYETHGTAVAATSLTACKAAYAVGGAGPRDDAAATIDASSDQRRARLRRAELVNQQQQGAVLVGAAHSDQAAQHSGGNQQGHLPEVK
jgi:hypothetical protein